jgi:hypothetical protein
VLVLPGCATVPRRHPQRAAAASASRWLYVVRRGWHVDIGLEVDALGPQLQPLAREFPGATYLVFGFGDRHYLLARKRGLSETFGALWPGDGLILLTALNAAPARAFPTGEVIALRVNQDQELAAEAFIRRSVDSAEADPRPYAPGPYAGSAFFLATQRYSALYTCNTWVAADLAAAGLPVHGPRVLLAGELWAEVRGLKAMEQRAR